MPDSIVQCDFEGRHSITVLTSRDRAIMESDQVQGFQKKVDKLLDAGVDRLVLDLENVAHMGSEFLSALIKLHTKLVLQGQPKHKAQQNARSRAAVYRSLPNGRGRTIFAILPDRESAAHALAGAGSVGLAIWSVQPHLLAVFSMPG